MTLPRLTTHDLQNIARTRHYFEKAQALTNVPWQIIAALWFRESGTVAAPDRVGGQFQFDPPLTAERMDALLKQFTPIPENERDDYVRRGMHNDFQTHCILAACFFRYKAKPIVTLKITDAEVKDAMWSWNGRAKYHKSPDGSPYVMNGYDEKHNNMRLVGTVPDKTNPKLRVKIDRPETRPGAFVVYKQLKGELK